MPRTTIGPCLALVLTWVSSSHAALTVTSTNPGRYALNVPRTLGTIQVFFNQMLVAPTPGAVRVSGTMSGLHTGSVTVADNLLTWQNTGGAFFPGEMVVLNLRSDLRGVTNETLLGGYYRAFTIASGAGSMSWSPRQAHAASDVPYFIYGGDLDENGTPDVASPNEGTNDVSVFLNPGGGFFSAHDDYGVGQRPSSIFGEDLDNDGDQDLATADINSGTMTVLRNNGDGTFQPGVPYDAGFVCRQVHGADFDGDNDVDLITTDYSGDRVFLFLNQGNANFSVGLEFAQVSAGPFAVRCADLSGDGHVDIAVACQDADSLTVLKNNGLGAFSRSGTYRIADLPWDLAANDLDGDSDCDLAAVASLANRVVVLQNDGAGGLPTRTQAVTGSFPLGVSCGDLDGDGDIDVTTANYSGASVGVYRNNGAGTLALQATLPCMVSGSYTWAHDLDGDNDLDLSVVDEEADQLFVWYNGGVPTGGLRFCATERCPPRVDRTDPSRGAPRVPMGGRGGEAGVLAIYAVSGRRVRTLFEGRLPAEPITWDGRNDAGRRWRPVATSRGSIPGRSRRSAP
ncbi:MAG: VCBS repeat-containing protein [Candidatus Eisenbacteria bacterium]